MLAVLFAASCVTHMECNRKQSHTESDAQSIAMAAATFALEHGRAPFTVSELAAGPEPYVSTPRVSDRWGTPWLILSDARGNVVIMSAGEDALFGTTDDVYAFRNYLPVSNMQTK